MYRRTIIFQSLTMMLSARFHREIDELSISQLITHSQLDPRIKVVGQQDSMLFVDHYGSMLLVMANPSGKVISYREGAVENTQLFLYSCKEVCDWRLVQFDSALFDMRKPVEAAL